MNARRTPKTIIVLLNWNSREMTAECIRSLLAMDNKDFEVLIIDNGSHDGSVDYLRNEFPCVTVLPQSRNLGFAVGCNVGIEHALGRSVEYVLLLNNDTIVHPRFLDELLKVADLSARSAIVSPKIYFGNLPDRLWWAGGNFSLWSGIPIHKGRKSRDVGQFDEVTKLDWATGCACLIHCNVLRQVGLFDESFFGNVEDLDLSLRARKAGYEIWYAPEAKLWHKEGIDYRKNAGEYLRKFTGTRNLLFVMRKHAGALHWMTFLPNFLFRHVAFYVALSLVRRDFRSAWAVLQGIGAFLGANGKSGAEVTENQTRSGIAPHVCADKDSSNARWN